MEMRAIEDIAIGEDLTPPLTPLAAVLHYAALSSHCSACFSALPKLPFSPSTPTFPQNSSHVPSDTPTPLYCSPNCSCIDSPLHFSSAEPQLLSLFTQSPPSTWTDSSDLRLSLRLAYIFQNQYSILPRVLNHDQRLFPGGKIAYPFQENENSESPDDYLKNKEKPMENMERIAGLMTNRENLIFRENRNIQFQDSDEHNGNCEDSCENMKNVLERIREGVKMMAKARRMCVNEDENVDTEDEFVLEEMVLCLVMTNAVEVQDKNGSTIGIAVYDTAFSWINHSCSPNACYRFLIGMDGNEQPPSRITPAATNGLMREGDMEFQFSERNGYGPRVIVRSIKDVDEGEDVTIAYTDLLQPKGMRQTELWLKYRFSCSCKRCAAVPTTYVDYALQALSAHNPNSDCEIEKLIQNFDDAITDYLSVGDPKSCYKQLENLLIHGDLSDKSPQKVKLHPFHHVSLNAYTTLASAYKVHASDLLSLNYEVERHKLEAFNKHKTSSAYSLLLAGVVNHLFMFESALLTTVANFWIHAGESLLNLARKPLWDSSLKRGLILFKLPSFLNLNCNDCCLIDTLEPNSRSPDRKLQLEEMNSQLHNCIANITPKVWRILASESSFLKLIQNPIDLSWLASPESSRIPEGYSQLEAEECNDQVRMNLILLGIHCLRYGALLSSICYGLSVEMNYYRTLEL